MDYIYQLKPVKKRGKLDHHEVKERFALPAFNAYDIEHKVFQKFGRYRIQYYPGIETGAFKFIIKVGVSNDPGRRVKGINRNWKSGRTEYMEVGPITYLRIVLFIFRCWFSTMIFIPGVFFAVVVLLIIFL